MQTKQSAQHSTMSKACTKSIYLPKMHTAVLNRYLFIYYLNRLLPGKTKQTGCQCKIKGQVAEAN